jgi:hypothetical protein
VDHRALSLAFLKTSGLIPVRVRPNQKDPFPEWDPQRAVHEDHNATLKLLADTVLNFNIGGLFHGRWVDVDIDTKSDNPTLRSALDMFLPPSKYVWGRASKPESHRAYMLQSDLERNTWTSQLRTIKKAALGDVSYSIEVRGGKPENGMFTVLPGSRHPSEEDVEWVRELDPTVSAPVIPIHRLIKGIRMAQAAAMLATFWQEGMRNDLSLALSGLMWRIRASTMAILGYDEEGDVPDDETFILKQKDAERLLEAVLTLSGDDEADRASRLLNFNNTWRKLDTDPTARVSGGRVLAEMAGEGGADLVKALYRLLSDNDGAEQLEAVCEQFAMWYGQGVLIDKKMVEVGLPIPWMNKEQANNSLAGQKIRMGDKRVTVVAILFNTSMIQRVYGLTFDPSTTERVVETKQGIMINQWRGFAVEPSPQSVTNSEMEPFIDYVHSILAAGNETLGEWIIDWCADLIQDPSNKPGTSLVLVGAHGAGKTFLGEQVLGKIIGPSHYVQINSIETLTSKFNVIAENKIFLQCDEAMHSHQKEVAAKLKSIITDEMMTIEPKNVNAYKKPNHMRVLFTSNDEQAAIFIDPTPHERRFTVSRVSPRRATDMEYWTHMRSWMELSLPKVLRWLQDRKYDKNTIRRPIDTDAKRELQRVGVDPEISWIVSRIAEGFPIDEAQHEHWFQAFDSNKLTENDIKRDTLRRDSWPNYVEVPSLEADFRAYVRRHGRSVYSGSITTNIKRTLPPGSLEAAGQRTVEYNDPRHGQLVKRRVRLYHWPPKDLILEHLRHKFGPMIDDLIAAEQAKMADLDHLGSKKSQPNQSPEPATEEF